MPEPSPALNIMFQNFYFMADNQWMADFKILLYFDYKWRYINYK